MKKRTNSDFKLSSRYNIKEEESIASLLFHRSNLNEFNKNTIRSPKSVRYPKFSPKTLHPEEIKELIRLDKDKNAQKLNLGLPTRDVSHIKDKHGYPPIDLKMIQSVLPTEIHHLEKMIKSSDQYGIPNSISPQGILSPLICKRETCVERTLMTHSHSRVNKKPFELDPNDLDRFNLGNPTGRQEIENLRKWLGYMKENYLQDFDLGAIDASSIKNANLIYTMCAREIVRQVSVQCLERGETLKEIFEIFIKIYKLKRNKMQKVIQDNLEKYEEKSEEIKEFYQKIKTNQEEKISSLMKVIEKKKLSKKLVKENAEFYHKQ